MYKAILRRISLNKIAHIARPRSLAYTQFSTFDKVKSQPDGCPPILAVPIVLFARTHNLNDFLSNLGFVKGVNGHNYGIA